MTKRNRFTTLVASAAVVLLSSVAAWSQGGSNSPPNLAVTGFSLNPATPTQGQPVQVSVRVTNQGGSPVGGFQVQWWPGENYASGAACTWNLPNLAGNASRTLNCTYAGYPSWYSSIKTRVIVDPANTVVEINEADNDRRYPITVKKAIVFVPLLPNLFISEMSLNPPVPVQGQPVQVRIGVYNNGKTPSGPNRVHWWPGENYPAPACGWNVGPIVANGGRILTCTYAGYPSWYGNIRTKAAADALGAVVESNEGDNVRLMQIQVKKP